MSARRKSRKGDTEEEGEKGETPAGSVSPATALDEQRGSEDGGLDDGLEESVDEGANDSEDGSLMIADMQEGKDTDDTERDSEEDDKSQLVFNGTMTRRQSKQFQDAGANFAVFSVRSIAKTKNRTCEYCGVVKATPAALIRHVRKHTGERPFVCPQCGKAYKAKRSLHLHQNSHHKELGKMLPPTPSSLPTQVPLPSAITTISSPTPAISEATKSLLRETLESSRKARDGSNSSQNSEAQTNTGSSPCTSERLSTPNLVNLLTSDISKKPIQQEDSGFPKAVSLLKPVSEVNANYIVNPALVKNEREEELDEGHMVKEEDEQAEDLSMSAVKAEAHTKSSSDKLFKCDFCTKSFKSESSRASHSRTAHNIVINYSGNQPQPTFTHLGHKPNSNISVLPHSALELTNHEAATDLSFSSTLTKKMREPTNTLLSQESIKMELPTVTGVSSDSPMLDESNTLPYHVTYRMVQDLNVEELRSKASDKPVLVVAEDGGNRRLRMSVLKETVLATRLDGINNVTGRNATFFKCHLCQRVFSSLLRFNHHLPSHYDTEVPTYDCRYCEASFRSHVQIVKHLQCHREKFSGLNQAGTGLNSSALLLEDFNKKHKQDHHSDNNNTTVFSPPLLSDESLNNTPHLSEPGERSNGGYSCVKCRKSFSREYLLQRHMRIHQNQDALYSQDSESGFSGEMDTVEHRRQAHGGKRSEQLQYTSLLKSLNDSNNNTSNNKFNSSSNVYNMKAFDLLRGEEVEVRTAAEVTETDRDELARRAMMEEYQKAMMLMKAVQMSAAAGNGDKPMSVEQMNTQLLQLAQTAANEEMRKKIRHDQEEFRKKEKKRLAEEDARLKEEQARKRKHEKEKLKRILAQEGMGDVTVVLPDAPPPDESIDITSAPDKPTDLSTSRDPPSAIGFMARKPAVSTTGGQMNNVIESGFQSEGSTVEVCETTTSTTTKESAVGEKRPAPASLDANLGPPSKNRRKAHKPQRINHGEADSMEREKGDDNNNINNNSKYNNNNSNTSNSRQLQLEPGKSGKESLHAPFLSADQVLLASNTLNQLNSLSGIGGQTSALTTATLKALMSSSLMPKETEKLIAGLDNNTLNLLNNIGNGNNNQAIDLSTDHKDRRNKATLPAPSVYQAYMSKMTASSSSSPSLSSSPPAEGSKRRKSKPMNLTRSVSLDPAALDSDSSQSQELTSAADLSKTQLLNLQHQAASSSAASLLGRFSSGLIPTTVDPDSLIGSPRVLMKPNQANLTDVPENFLGVIRGGQWNGKGIKNTLALNIKSRASSPSPVPSPTNSDASSSAESRKITTTSLSRTHSRLSVVDQPLDRNSLCKPKVLDDGRSVYSCTICHKNFLSLSDINRHMDFHEDIRPYKCKYCDYYARTNSQLKVHKLRHEGVREFCCRVCNYKGVTQSDLNRHMKSQVHVLRSNHVCSQCGEGFVTPNTLRDHILNCTGTADKSFENMSANDDEVNDDDYEEEELLNLEESQASNGR